MRIFDQLAHRLHFTCPIDAKSPAFGWRLKLSDSIPSSPAEQAKSPAELGITNFVKHISYKMIVPQS